MASDFVTMTGKAGRRSRYRPMSEINVTPFVDVMLVLLIVFMVTAPLLTVGVPVDLPKSKAQALSNPEEPLVLSINKDGGLFIQETEVEPANLVARLRAITENKLDTRIYLRADRSLFYGRVMEIMGEVNRAGFSRLALVSEQPEKAEQ